MRNTRCLKVLAHMQESPVLPHNNASTYFPEVEKKIQYGFLVSQRAVLPFPGLALSQNKLSIICSWPPCRQVECCNEAVVLTGVLSGRFQRQAVNGTPMLLQLKRWIIIIIWRTTQDTAPLICIISTPALGPLLTLLSYWFTSGPLRIPVYPTWGQS